MPSSHYVDLDNLVAQYEYLEEADDVSEEFFDKPLSDTTTPLYGDAND